MKIKRNDTFNNVLINRFCGSRTKSANVFWGALRGVNCPLCGAPFIEDELQLWAAGASKSRGGALAKLIKNVFGEQVEDIKYKKILDRMYGFLSNRKQDGGSNIVMAFQDAQKGIITDIETCYRDQLAQNIYTLEEAMKNSSSSKNLLKKCLGFMRKQQAALITHDFLSQKGFEIDVRGWIFYSGVPESDADNLWAFIKQLCFSRIMYIVDEYKFISKYESRRAPKKICDSFANAYGSSIEHAVAASHGGEWCITNYLPLHVVCNEEKGNISWPQLVRLGLTNNNRVRNCVHQMEDVWDEVVVERGEKPQFHAWRKRILSALNRNA